MLLDVPFTKQNPRECGLACVDMVAKYHGLAIPFSVIQNEIPLHQHGTYLPQLGVFFLRRGFSVEIITQHPALFTIADRSKSQSEILQHIERTLSETTDENKRLPLSYYVDYLKAGGKVVIAIPDRQHITSELEANRPTIALLTTRFLFSEPPVMNFHFVVMTGIDGDTVHVNDPAKGATAHHINDFMFGIHASTAGDLDNGSIMKIYK